jgi:hypothetical protein
MTKQQSSKQNRTPKQLSAPVELSDAQIERVSGGDKGAPAVGKPLNIGSQASGAGAGKISFDPF